MANHGTIAHGPDLDVAVEQARLLEWACELYWRAAAIGTPRTLDVESAQAFVAAIIERGYGTPEDGATHAHRRDDAHRMRVVTLGVHVVDVLVRPVTEIPAGAGRTARRADPDHAGRHRRRHRDHAGEARARRCTAPARSAPTRSATCSSTCSGATGSTPRTWSAATASRRRRACCRSVRTARARPFTWSAPTPRTPPPTRPAEEIAQRHAPAPRRPGVHGRRARRPGSSPSRASTGS